LQDKTCGICVSHQVLVCLSLLNCYCYFYELIRVCREGGFIAFDIYSDEEWNQQVIDSWLPLVKNSDPTVLSEKRIIELFSSHGCQLIGKFNAQTGFDFTTYLVFKKGDSKSSPVSL
jgi:hypothetical protein